MSLTKSLGLLDLPLEIRLMIYEQLFNTSSESLEVRQQTLTHPLMAVCKLLRHEVQPVLMSGFRLIMSALGGRHLLDDYGLDNSDRLAFQPLVTTEPKARARLPGYLRSWSNFCKSSMVEVVPLCGQIHIWSGYKKIGVTIIPQKNTSPLISLSDSDGGTIKGLDDLTSDRVGSRRSFTNLLLKRELHKALSSWRLLCTVSPLSIDTVNQIAQQLEHIVVQAARCDNLERNILFYHSKMMDMSVPRATLEEIVLADLETIWLATNRGLVVFEKLFRHDLCRKAYQFMCPTIQLCFQASRLVHTARWDQA